MKTIFWTLCFLMLSSKSFALCLRPGMAEVVTNIKHPELTENSGIDFSNRHKDLFWTLNDSGNDPVIYALDINGKAHGRYEVKGAQNVDWEDIALAACFHDASKDCIYVADIGDNLRIRDEFQVYVVEEPSDLKKDGVLSPVSTLRFKARPRNNFEAFAVDPGEKLLYFISKSDKLHHPKGTSTIYTLGVAEDVLRSVGVLDFNKVNPALRKEDKVVTGADFDPASKTFVLSTYGEAFEFKLSELPEFHKKVSRIKAPKQKQGEAVAYYWREGKPHIVLASEGKKEPLYLIGCE